MFLPLSFTELVVACFAPAMTTPTCLNLLLLLHGWLLAPRRTITAMLQAAGLSGKRHHARFHRLFAHARWGRDQVGLALLRLILARRPATDVVFLVGDDTLARKCGHKIFGVGMHYDPQLSSRSKEVMSWGHSWVVLGVIVALPFRADAWFCLPILFRLYRSKQTVAREGEAAGPYRTRPELMVQMLQLLGQAQPTRHFHLLVDAAYSGASVVRHLPPGFDLTGRTRMDALLCAPAPPRPLGQKGRSRVRGRRLPTPRAMLREQAGQRLSLKIYGRQARLRVVGGLALWYAVARGRLLRIVAVSPLRPGCKEEAFFSTVVTALPAQVLVWFSWRWPLEVTFHEAKGYLGFEEPQGWSRSAVERTAPVALLLYSLVVLWFAEAGHHEVQFPCRPWYRQKRAVSFADMLRTLRRLGLRRRFVRPRSPATPDQNALEDLISLAAWVP